MITETSIDWREWKESDLSIAALNLLLGPHGVRLENNSAAADDSYGIRAFSGPDNPDNAADPNGIDLAGVKHFLAIARRGGHGAASGGEQRAYRLAKRLKQSLDDLAGLDSSAIEGLCGMIRAQGSGAYDAVENLLRGIK